MIELNKPGDLVIKQRYSPRIKLLIAVIVAAVLIAAAGLIYNYGLTRAGFERESAVQTQHSMQEETRKLRDDTTSNHVRSASKAPSKRWKRSNP